MNAPLVALSVAGTAEQVARGEHLARAICAGCHSPNFDVPLVGGVALGRDSSDAVGNIVSRKLAPGSELHDWSDGEIMRALRSGVNKNGRVIAMPIAGTTRLCYVRSS